MQHIDVVGYLTVEAEGDAFEPRRRAPVGRPGAALADSRVVPRHIHHRIRLPFRL
jgi:hypothetical protein